jgi:hypothetical protein
MSLSRIILFTALFAQLLLNFGCGAQKNAELNSTRETEALISRSEKLTKLDKLCRNLPAFDVIEPKVKSVNQKFDTLFYYYELKTDTEDLKSQIKEHLIQDGWLLKVEKQSDWEYQIEFEKETYWLQFSYNKFSRLNYSINCKDFSISR